MEIRFAWSQGQAASGRWYGARIQGRPTKAIAKRLPAIVGAIRPIATIICARRRNAPARAGFGVLVRGMDARSGVTALDCTVMCVFWVVRCRPFHRFAEGPVTGPCLSGDDSTCNHRPADQGPVDESASHDLLCKAQCFQFDHSRHDHCLSPKLSPGLSLGPKRAIATSWENRSHYWRTQGGRKAPASSPWGPGQLHRVPCGSNSVFRSLFSRVRDAPCRHQTIPRDLLFSAHKTERTIRSVGRGHPAILSTCPSSPHPE